MTKGEAVRKNIEIKNIFLRKEKSKAKREALLQCESS